MKSIAIAIVISAFAAALITTEIKHLDHPGYWAIGIVLLFGLLSVQDNK